MPEVIEFQTRKRICVEPDDAIPLADDLMTDEQVALIATLNDLAMGVAAGEIDGLTIIGRHIGSKAFFTASSIAGSQYQVNDLLAHASMLDIARLEILQLVGQAGISDTATSLSGAIAEVADSPDEAG